MANLGLGGAFNGGAAASADQLAVAREWVKGKTPQEIAAKGKEMGITPEQMGSVFGVSGDQAKATGYGSENGLYWNNGQAANAEQLATAQAWAKGKTSEEIAAKGKEMNLSPEQFGSVFGQSGAAATGVGYGTAGGLNDSAKGKTWNGSAWVNTAAPGGGGVVGGGGGGGAQITDIARQFQSMGLSDPSGANARLLSGQVNNPYLDSQADNITKRLNKNLQENILPGIGQGAQMAGQYGGSRQGIAQGKAIGETQDNLANALTNMYSSANEAAQGRMAQAAGNLSGIGAQVGIANSQGQNSYNLGLMSNATQNKGLDQQYALGQGNLALGNKNSDQQYALGQGNLNLGYQNSNQQYALGQGNLALGYQNSNQQYALGQGQLDNQRTANANSYALGQGNLALGNKNSDQQYSLGQGNLALGYQNSNQQYALGQGQLENQRTANSNSYNLGLQNNALGYANLDQNNQQFGANYGLNAMNAQTNWAQTQANIASQMYGQPINYFNNFNNNANGIAGQGGSTSQTNPGNPYIGAIGGYQLASKFF